MLVVDRLLGEWNIMIEFGCRNPEELHAFLREFREKYSDVLDVYEVHSPLEIYKLEQLPVELVDEHAAAALAKGQAKQGTTVDKTDMKLLYELNKDSSAGLLELGEKIGVTYETVSARIKKLKESGVVVKFTAKIGLGALGYDVYLISLDLRNMSKEKEAAMKAYIQGRKNMRYAFISASKPVVFAYIAVKNTDELNAFLLDIKEKFFDTIVNQQYLLSTGQLKYELFPEGFVDMRSRARKK
jgi:DNA-binding Lrp family transcriptional regulator